MTLAALAQSQNFATLLQVLLPSQSLAAGVTLEARLLSLAGDGTATALISSGQFAGGTLSLILAGPEAKQAALQPGATLVLTIEPPDEPGGPPRATLTDVRPPAVATAAPPGQALATATSLRASPARANATPAAPSQPAGQVFQPSAESVRPALGPAQLTPAGVAPSAPAGERTAVSPRALAGPLLGPALANQDSLAPLLANLRGVAQGSVALIAPQPLLRLADHVLAQALPAEGRALTPEALKDAIQRSGLFLEAKATSAAQTTQPQPDLKAALLALRGALEPLVQALGKRDGGIAPPARELANEAQSAAQRLPPPRRDGPLAPQPIAEPSLQPAERPLAIAETLLRQTDAALDRITLSQYASLPSETAPGNAAQPQRWLAEVPLVLYNGAPILPLQIEKEPQRQGPAGLAGPLWRVRFALDVEPMGPLQGVVTLQGRSVGVTLWAEREDTSRLLRGAAPGLEAALRDAEFDHGAIDVHTGHPHVMQATAGQFLDRLS